MRRKLLAITAGATAVSLSFITLASNHREAPITALDEKADITDLYAFVSYGPNQPPNTPPEKVTLILCVDPLLEPANGPTHFPFDPSILYELHVDNDQDAIADRTIQFRFQTEYRLPGVYTGLAGVGPNGANDPNNGNLVVPPRITTFDNPGLNLHQTYEALVIDRQNGTKWALALPNNAAFEVVPCNAGPRTMDYEALFAQGTYQTTGGISVFAGTVDDPFWIDLGAAFDTANFRLLGSGVPGVLTATEDASTVNLASDTVSGYAVNAIAIEMPIELLTASGQIEPPDSPRAVLGVWGTTSRQRVTVRRSPDPALNSGPWRQVQRIGNPLINELIVGIGFKDRFSMDRPRNDSQFASFFLDPPIAHIVEALYGGALAIPAPPRLDLLPLVTYAEPIAPPGTPSGPIADLLRINTGVPATPPMSASRLGLIGGDPAGYPNGRRLFDDVVDITLRVGVGGVLAAPFTGYNADVNGRLGDGVNVNDATYRSAFPYLASCPDGRNRRHVDPGEPGGGPIQ